MEIENPYAAPSGEPIKRVKWNFFPIVATATGMLFATLFMSCAGGAFYSELVTNRLLEADQRADPQGWYDVDNVSQEQANEIKSAMAIGAVGSAALGIILSVIGLYLLRERLIPRLNALD